MIYKAKISAGAIRSMRSLDALGFIDDFLATRFPKGGEKHVRMLAFLAKLVIFSIPLYIILIFDLSYVPLQRLVADITVYLLASAGYSPVINDLIISIPIKNGSWGAFINWDCTAWKSMLAFFALLMSTDRANKTKLLGLAVFLPLIFAVNLARIFFMFFYVRTFDLANYQLVHTVVWSWGMIAAVLVFWIVWMRFAPRFGVKANAPRSGNKYIVRRVNRSKRKR